MFRNSIKYKCSDKYKVLHMIAKLTILVRQREYIYSSTEDCVKLVSRGMHFKPFS